MANFPTMLIFAIQISIAVAVALAASASAGCLSSLYFLLTLCRGRILKGAGGKGNVGIILSSLWSTLLHCKVSTTKN